MGHADVVIYTSPGVQYQCPNYACIGNAHRRGACDAISRGGLEESCFSGREEGSLGTTCWGHFMGSFIFYSISLTITEMSCSLSIHDCTRSLVAVRRACSSASSCSFCVPTKKYERQIDVLDGILQTLPNRFVGLFILSRVFLWPSVE
jgi:hypothetical protein